MRETLTTIQALNVDAFDVFLAVLEAGVVPLPTPTSIVHGPDLGDELLEFAVTWDADPMLLSVAISSVVNSDDFPDEVDPYIEIHDETGFASKYLRDVVDANRTAIRVEHQNVRTNVISKHLLETKNCLNDTTSVVNEMYRRHVLMLQALVHINEQLTSAGLIPFDFDRSKIPTH